VHAIARRCFSAFPKMLETVRANIELVAEMYTAEALPGARFGCEVCLRQRAGSSASPYAVLGISVSKVGFTARLSCPQLASAKPQAWVEGSSIVPRHRLGGWASARRASEWWSRTPHRILLDRLATLANEGECPSGTRGSFHHVLVDHEGNPKRAPRRPSYRGPLREV
jgi:hypothetical protein